MPKPSMQRPDAAPVRVLAVVVLYKMQPSRSKTLAGLAQALAADPALAQQIETLVWDNGPTAIDESSLPLGCTYRHAPANTGVSGAYNAGAAMAGERDCGWLLLLDQDTSVTSEFLQGMLAHAGQVAGDEQVAAVVPFLYAGSFCLSPRLWRFGRHAPLPRPAAPYLERREMFAANSGTLMRVRALQEIGGYSSRFWLDYSDIEVFHRLHAKRYAIRIAADLGLEHEMAMLDYDRQMTPGRFAIFLAAEGDFMDLYRGPMERLVHLLRLCARILHQRSYSDPAFSTLSRKALWERLTTQRAVRLVRHERAKGSPGADRD